MLLNIRDVMSLSDPSQPFRRNIPDLDPVSNEFTDTEGRMEFSDSSADGAAGNVKNRQLDSLGEGLEVENWELHMVSGG